MKIAVAQIKCSLGDVSANISQVASLSQAAASKGCHVIVFPEMVDTGYEMSVIRETASSWDGESFHALQQIASDNNIHLICGISEKEDDKIYNSIAVLNPKGELIGKYRKAHLAAYPPLDEDSCISPGNSPEIVKIGGMKWGLMICYDLRFPELSRALVLNGAEILLLCSAWPFPRVTHWKTLTCARAIENQVYFIAANRVGSDGPVTFCGSSCIVDPYGVILGSAAEDREALIIAEISKETLESVRNRMPIFQHRRDDLYQLKFGKKKKNQRNN
jgi:omega-amidase